MTTQPITVRGAWMRNTAWVIASVIIAAGASTAIRGRRTEAVASFSQPSIYRAGDRIGFGEPAGSKGRRTVAVILNTGCYYCGTSGQFLRELAEESAQTPAFRLVLASAEPVDVVQRFAARHRIHPAEVMTVPRDQLRVSSVPTFLVANEDGVIERIWTGEQPPAARALILASLRGGQ